MKLADRVEILKHADAQGLRRVLIVTALPLEMRAVRAHVTQVGSCLGRDGNVVETGQFAAQGEEWLVVVAECGAGTHAAQSAVTYASLDFGPFEVALFIGVAASRKPEAPVGAVVVSNHVYFPYSGKYSGGEFSSRPHTFPVDNRLVGLAKKISRDEEWPSRIRDPLKQQLPDATAYPQPFPPSAFIAPIVSVEAVSADAESELERQISRHYGDSLALEMEGYGALFAGAREQTPSIVVRGISDMRKDKTPELDAIYQPVAAAHAAAFGFELIAAWSQSYPASRPLPSISEPPKEVTAEAKPAELSLAAIEHRATFVVSFAGNAADFTQEKIDRIIVELRTITEDPNLSLVRTEAGSFRMFIEARASDQARLKSPETSGILMEKFQARLLGVADTSEFLIAESAGDVLAGASRPLLDWPQTLPDGTKFDRPELDRLLTMIEESESSTTALLGLPGAGKSALLAAVGQSLQERKIPFLAIKADLLDVGVSDESSLAKSIGLLENPTTLLVRLSKFRPVVLIIDQLDALAGYVDLRTGRLNVLLNMVRRLSGLPNIHIVLSARIFEYEHDARLRTIRAESVTLELPSWSAVLSVLERHKILAAGWPTNAQEVMRSPQALTTYLKLGVGVGSEPFSTYQAMLNRLWTEHVLTRAEGPRLSKLAGSIAEQMAEMETLWLSSARYDEQVDDLNALISSGILTRNGGGGRIGFSHQTVFEHALARAFSQQTGRLSKYVLERESSLFVRPKLWAALTYLRDVEPVTYVAEMNAIWSTDNLRIHLRHLLVEFLGQQSDPTDQEALMINEALHSEHRKIALQAVAGSIGWFKRLQSQIAAAMITPGEDQTAAVILSHAWEASPDSVSKLIRAHWLPDQKFDRLTLFAIQSCPHWLDDVVDIALTVTGRTEMSAYEFDHMIGTLGVGQPSVALKLVLAQLNSRLDLAIEEGERRAAEGLPDNEDERLAWRISRSPEDPIIKVVEDSHGWDSLEALAKANPQEFLNLLWPWFRKATDALRDISDERDGPGFSVSYYLDFRFDGESPLDLPEHPLTGALRTAAEELARGNEDEFRKWLDRNQEDDSTPAQRLFAHALATEPEKYADRSLQFLLDDPDRFHLGSIVDHSSTTTRLVRAASPHWDVQQLEQFTKAVLAYSPRRRSGLDAKGKRWFGQYTRRLKTNLFEALPPDRISEDIRSFIAEQRRQFPQEQKEAKQYGARWIGSPIAAANLALASDDDIINAFEGLPDASGWDHPKDWMKGGNVELSREFAEFAKAHPERAVEIIKKFEPAIGTRAAGYALEAMSETAPAQLIFELIAHLDVRGFASEEYRGNAARAVEKLVRRNVQIEEATISIIEGWLQAHSDGQDNDEEDEVDTAASSNNKKSERDDSILWGMGGLSIIPHGNYPTLEVLFRIFLQRKEYQRLIKMLNSRLESGENKLVWKALLRFMPYVPSTHIHELTDFLGKLFDEYPELARTHEGLMLLGRLHWKAPDFVGSLLSAWDFSQSARDEQGYGELVALISLVQPALEWPKELLAEILSKPDLANARVGAAYAAVNVWPDGKWQQGCSLLLQRIAPIADKPAWSAVFDLFRLVDEITPDPLWIDLLKAIEAHISKAKGVNSTFVVERLQTLLPHCGALVGNIARGLVGNWRTELGDLSTANSSVAPEFVDIAITLHRLGPDTREIGIELFEDLLEANAYTAKDTLDQIDNRFRSAPASRRLRLPRRVRKARSSRKLA
ncbi:nucleoside phosphorylase [Aminobacter lissarensis]|uniref:Nucleoside phosphorylase n=1 Tax=Aminobacter carboxidus TaxID=376165 RepID=A0A8E2BDP6_9HYPH|nr:AAA family ATPase [Aminobacter lissarensis]MBB6466030.1 nucleoside phosphorylase [Aminobacter lissarensis]